MAAFARSSSLASSWTEIEGMRIHARAAPRPGAPSVVLVHGIAVSSRYMVPIAEALAPFASVHAPDLPGFGRSTKPRRVLGVSELAHALGAWMAAAGLGRATLLANSFGCQVAVELAVREPVRARGMVLVGPTMDRWARTIPTQVARWVRSGLHERPSLPVVLARNTLDAGAGRIWRTFLDGLHDSVEEKLPAIETPTLVVRGERDPIVPERWAAEVARLLPRGRLAVVPGAGHALNYSRPDDLARLVRVFLSELGEPL